MSKLSSQGHVPVTRGTGPSKFENFGSLPLKKGLVTFISIIVTIHVKKEEKIYIYSIQYVCGTFTIRYF
jgi:hypothetical protein